MKKFRTGKLHTGTHHMFSKKKKKYTSSFMKASSFIATCLHCTKSAWEWDTATLLLPLLCTVLLLHNAKMKQEEKSEIQREKYRQATYWKYMEQKDSERANRRAVLFHWALKTWQMGQNFYYFITSRSHARAGSFILGTLLLPAFLVFFCKKYLYTLLQASSFCFCCCSVSHCKRKHASTWHLIMVQAGSPPKRLRKWIVGKTSAFSRHKSH